MLARWQHEFDGIRLRYPSRWGFTVRPQLRPLPLVFGRLVGGACYAFGRIWISREVIEVPAQVRAYLLAQEWGHVASGHGMARYVFLGCAITLGGLDMCGAIAPGRVAGGVAALVLLFALLGLAWWMHSPRREYEADDVAVAINGKRATWEARRWMNGWAGGRSSRERCRRLQRLSGD